MFKKGKEIYELGLYLDILEDKTYLKRWIQKVFEGSLSFKDLKEFVKKNRLIVEAANKFLFDEGHAIQVSELIKKEKKIENIDELLNYLK